MLLEKTNDFLGEYEILNNFNRIHDETVLHQTLRKRASGWLVGEWLDGPWYMYSMSLLVLCTGHQYRSMNGDGRTDGSRRIHHQINNIKMFSLHLLHLIIWMYCSGLWVVVKGEVDEMSKKAATTKLTTRHDREVQLDWSALWKMELKSICLKFAVCKSPPTLS